MLAPSKARPDGESPAGKFSTCCAFAGNVRKVLMATRSVDKRQGPVTREEFITICYRKLQSVVKPGSLLVTFNSKNIWIPKEDCGHLIKLRPEDGGFILSVRVGESAGGSYFQRNEQLADSLRTSRSGVTRRERARKILKTRTPVLAASCKEAATEKAELNRPFAVTARCFWRRHEY